MKKKFLLFLVTLMLGFCAFAGQDYSDFSYVNEYNNSIVIYQCPDNWEFSIIKVDGVYRARLYNSVSKKGYQGVFDIKKGKKTKIKLMLVIQGTMSEVQKFIKPKLEELYSFGDNGEREKLPQDVVVSKDGKTAKLSFVVPFTNVVNVKDKNGAVLYSCNRIGAMHSNELKYFSMLEVLPKPKNRPMTVISYDKNKTIKTSKKLWNIVLPDVWKPHYHGYILSKSTEADSIVYEFTGKWENYHTKQFYEVMTKDILFSEEFFIVPETVKTYKKGDLFFIEYELGDVNYWESNKRIVVCRDVNGEEFSVLYFCGFTDFVNKNRVMFDEIISTIK